MEKYQKFRQEYRKIEGRPQEIQEAYRVAWNAYQNKLTELQRLEVIGGENIEAVRVEVEALQLEAFKLKSQADAFSGSDTEGIREIIASTPGSSVHQLALEVVEEALTEIEGHEKRIEKLMNVDLVEAKEKYLEAVKAVGNAFREYFECHGQGLLAQRCLSKAERKVPRSPKMQAPRTEDFCLNGQTVHEFYGNRPFHATL